MTIDRRGFLLSFLAAPLVQSPIQYTMDVTPELRAAYMSSLERDLQRELKELEEGLLRGRAHPRLDWNNV